MRVGITGAAGYVGRALLDRLEADGHDVVALDRRRAELKKLPLPWKLIEGDIRDRKAVGALVSQTDVVIHLAAYVHRETFTGRDIRECFSINLEGTQQILRAIQQSGRRQHLIFLSTVGVYGSSFSRAKEDASCHPATPYSQSKLEAERAVTEAIRKGIITGWVLRPAMVVGAGAPGNIRKLLKLLRWGVCPLIKGGLNEKSMIDVRDLATVIIQMAAPAAKANGRVYNVAADPPLTVRQIADVLSGALGRSLTYIPIPGWLASVAGQSSRLVSRLSGRKLPDLSQPLEVFGATATVDNSLLKKDFSFSFRQMESALEEAARQALKIDTIGRVS